MTSTYMESIFPADWILGFERMQQWTMEWVNSYCALSFGVNMNIPHLHISDIKLQSVHTKNTLSILAGETWVNNKTYFALDQINPRL